ncbi:nucleotidyltransferase domain-containing protein [Methylotuvimicrobium sp.]|uniref:nucleotidyltransferase domain-containing protein n=1 Tax=Methylotuvimicrobium sp. TaxID=2822413 RepID=UPI003D6516FE
MRISKFYRDVIKSKAKEVFGKDVKVNLFGSRIDDTQKGGDIDLYIVVSNQQDLFQKKLRFLAQVKRVLGEQKIDVIFNEDETRLVEQEAKKWSISL